MTKTWTNCLRPQLSMINFDWIAPVLPSSSKVVWCSFQMTISSEKLHHTIFYETSKQQCIEGNVMAFSDHNEMGQNEKIEKQRRTPSRPRIEESELKVKICTFFISLVFCLKEKYFYRQWQSFQPHAHNNAGDFKSKIVCSFFDWIFLRWYYFW